MDCILSLREGNKCYCEIYANKRRKMGEECERRYMKMDLRENSRVLL